MAHASCFKLLFIVLVPSGLRSFLLSPLRRLILWTRMAVRRNSTISVPAAPNGPTPRPPPATRGRMLMRDMPLTPIKLVAASASSAGYTVTNKAICGGAGTLKTAYDLTMPQTQA
ncbi:hypothetical protein C8R46DRAFT_139906 [Mycena filopes]|nr:hypothetical protein C8R46DRAFT_139906 [Mycena filopes]